MNNYTIPAYYLNHFLFNREGHFRLRINISIEIEKF
jgi:hypothetical protein